MSIPRFLTNTRNKPLKAANISSTLNEYRPLIGAWLIRMALMLKWYVPKSDDIWPDIFLDSNFMETTGLPEEASPRLTRGKPTSSFFRNLLLEQLKILEREELSPDLTLFRNLTLFAEILELSEANQALLLFASLVNLFPTFQDAISSRCEKTSNQHLVKILAGLTRITEQQFMEATGSNGTLFAAGILKLNHGIVDLESKIDMIKGLNGVLLTPHADSGELMIRFLRKATPPTLTLANFPHLSADSSALLDFLGNASEQGTPGVNILFSGKPGVGKTEYAQALARKLGLDLYEIAYSDSDGDPIRGENRLRAYSFCQRLLSNTQNCILLFDEVEDVFPYDMGFFRFLFGGDDEENSRQVGGKAWINRTMEHNRIPAIWISNRIWQIDHAYRRRFDYSVNFPIPPKKVRLEIAMHHLGIFDPPEDWLDRIAGNEDLTPAQYERAAKVAKVASADDNQRARELVDQTLQRSITLLDQRRIPGRYRVWTGYSLEWLNLDTDIRKLIEGLKKRPYGNFCFYGAAGTGKSELARYMAEELGLPVIIRRASDLLDKYVGESEKNIASMFEEARQQNALLVLDEADSFLADRRGAHQIWEVTQVNELLTQMEAFDGIFVCTTNLMEKLDLASLRRFSFKVCFKVLNADQRWGLFQQELNRLGGAMERVGEWEAQVRRLEKLTPGDFAVANRQFELWGAAPTAGELFENLRRECETKGGMSGKIGFSN